MRLSLKGLNDIEVAIRCFIVRHFKLPGFATRNDTFQLGLTWILLDICSILSPVCFLISERGGIPGHGLLYLTTPQARSLSGICVQAGEAEI